MSKSDDIKEIEKDFKAFEKEIKAIAEFLSKNTKQSFDSILSKLINLLKDDEKELEALFKEYKDKIKEPTFHTQWEPDYTNLIRLKNVDDVKSIILKANNEKKVIRVAGAQHSTPEAVFDNRKDPNIVHVKLEGDLMQIGEIQVDGKTGIASVRVGAGCHLGIDPSDEVSNAGNSFTRVISSKGYALPILGGMSHQTIGGFMSTSTAGGSIKYGFHEKLISIEWVDGLGNYHVSSKNDNNTDDFYGVGVSMGLLGVLVYVTVELQPVYFVDGDELTLKRKDSIIQTYDQSFLQSFNTYDYSHCVWFPQKGVDRVLQFQGNQLIINNENKNTRIPYQHPLKKTYMNYVAAIALYLMNDIEFVNDKEHSIILTILNAMLLDLVMSIKKENHFRDYWYIALPNDDQARIDTIIRVQFTEIWVDVADITTVFDNLKDLVARDNDAGGNFGIELYMAKESKFWMSQSYGHDVVRVDPYWWEFNPHGNLNDYFTKFWDILLPIASARLHWGKHFPAFGTSYNIDNNTKKIIGPQYVGLCFPKFGDWLNLRNKYDPNQIFVTDYWRQMFGIQKLN